VYAGQHASSFIASNKTAQLNSRNDNTLCPIGSEALASKFNVGVIFKHTANQDYDENNFETENGGKYTLYITEEKLKECLRITIKIGEVEVSAILNTGCELTIMDKNLYEKIKQRGNKHLELPAQHLTLVSAFNNKNWRVKRKIFLPLKLGAVSTDHVFLVSPQLLTSAILGIDFFC
jgi:hypothetical protein